MPLSRSPAPQTAPAEAGTAEGFVATLTWTRRHFGLVAVEILWRWIFGIPALLLLWREGTQVLARTPWQATGIQGVSISQLLTDPIQASATLAAFLAVVTPSLLQVATWLVPLLFVFWIAVSSVGRSRMLARMNASPPRRMGTIVILQAVRLLPVLLTLVVWWGSLQVLARHTILEPISSGGEPEMMLYAGGAIGLTLTLFVLSAATAWISGVAPILAMRNDTGPVQSLLDTLQAKRLRIGLFEMNLVLGIAKIALLVLAMVLSACPLPFATVMSGEALLYWNLAVLLGYVLASDFFHVARLHAYLQLVRAQAGAGIREDDRH